MFYLVHPSAFRCMCYNIELHEFLHTMMGATMVSSIFTTKVIMAVEITSLGPFGPRIILHHCGLGFGI